VSDAQFTILISAISAVAVALAGALRWAVGRVTTSNDRGTAALVANTASNAVLVTKMDELIRSFGRVEERFESHSGVTAVPDEIRQMKPKKNPRARTNPLGTPVIGAYRPPRTGSHHDDED